VGNVTETTQRPSVLTKEQPIKKGGAHSLLPSQVLVAQNTKLLQKNHLPRLHKIASLKPVEIDPAGEGAGIPPNSLVSSFLVPINQSCQLLAEDVVNSELDVAILWQSIFNSGNLIEGIGVVLTKAEHSGELIGLIRSR